MTENRKKTLDKAISGYLSTKIVFAMDFMLSSLASLLVLVVAEILNVPLTSSAVFEVVWIVVVALANVLVLSTSKTYRLVIRYTTLRDVLSFTLATLVKNLIMGVSLFIIAAVSQRIEFNKYVFVLLFLDYVLTLIFLIGVRMLMIVAYNLYMGKIKENAKMTRILIAGTTAKDVSTLDRFFASRRYKVGGFVTTNIENSQRVVSGYPVFRVNSSESLARIISSENIAALFFSTEDDLEDYRDTLVSYATDCGLKIFVSYRVNEYMDGKSRPNVRELRIEDLLGREEIKIDLESIKKQFKDKNVMITGAAGSIGSELCRQLAGFGVASLILYDNAETPLHNLRLEFEENHRYITIHPVVGDVRMEGRLDYVFRTFKPDIVFHAAAYKHVPLMEENPCEAVLVNDFGTMKVADKCVEYGVEKMIMISTDKAVNPTNVMGCSKRIAEIYVQSLGLAIERGEVEGVTKFVTTRFGNVLGSNGSVIPRFKYQIEKGGPVTVTHPEICRFFMTIPEACRLVMEASANAINNSICVFDMGRPVKIVDLAKKMIRMSGLKPGEDIDIVFTGLRPGEKLYEEVLCKAENTDPTSHDRVRIAHVREYSYHDASDAVHELAELARCVNISGVIRKMKSVVPEFISRNSIYERYDAVSKKKFSGGGKTN